MKFSHFLILQLAQRRVFMIVKKQYILSDKHALFIVVLLIASAIKCVRIAISYLRFVYLYF